MKKKDFQTELAKGRWLGMVRDISHKPCHWQKAVLLAAMETNDWDDISVMDQLLLFIPMQKEEMQRDVIQNSKWQSPNVWEN